MSQEPFSVFFKDSPMKRATLRGLQRNAAVVLGNAGTGDDAGGAGESGHPPPTPLTTVKAARARGAARA